MPIRRLGSDQARSGSAPYPTIGAQTRTTRMDSAMHIESIGVDVADFSAGEYATRLDRIRSAMEHAGVEVLVLSDPSNKAWATGYDGWSF